MSLNAINAFGLFTHFRLTILWSTILVLVWSAAAIDRGYCQENRTLSGKVFCGYQGWFGAKADGTNIGFDNYQFAGRFEPGTCVIDLWPDLSEFDADETFPTNFKFADGSVASVFSSANPKTVERHFQWMSEYGIDGIFLQRFGWVTRDQDGKPNPTRSHRNRVLANVQRSARNNKKLWALMYDLSSLGKGDIEAFVKPDLQRLIDGETGLKKDTQVVLHNGKPLIAVWGIGFNDGRGYSLEECRDFVAFLKDDPRYGGFSVMVGVPYYWREQRNDCLTSETMTEILELADVISPWSVGRYKTVEEIRRFEEHVRLDLKSTKQRGKTYLPVVFPGFSWNNLAAQRKDLKPTSIPRLGGRFMWEQAKTLKSAGAGDSYYVAMFDELNEATCIFKCSEKTPVGASKFLTYQQEGVASDHYLWLTGKLGQLTRNEIGLDFPIRSRTSSQTHEDNHPKIELP